MNETQSLQDPAKGTAGSSLTDYYTVENSQTAAPMLVRAGLLRTQVDALGQDVAIVHQEIRDDDLAQRAAAKGRSGVPSLLRELADGRGMAWSDIAKLVSVSVSAVRKWRADQAASADHRLALARLAAFLDLLEEYAIEDPAQWMEMRLPLQPGYVVTPLDIYQRGNLAALLEYASQRLTAEQILDEIDEGWRDRRSDFEAFDAPDGAKAISFRGK